MQKDLILFMGQSNMQGETEGCSETEEVPGALEYKYLTDTLTPLKNPVGENIGHDMKPFLNPDGLEFLDQLKDPVLLAPEKTAPHFFRPLQEAILKKQTAKSWLFTPQKVQPE